MDHYSILDQNPSSSAMEGDMPASSAKSAAASVSAGIAAANAHPAKPPEPVPRFPGEDAGRSLAEMAHRDLDATLQLLAERAQYITGANGTAIALRRGDHNDMLCRASSGSNAPELGALLSMEYGLSGESVRTRQILRCDDTERDPRVNHDVCRALGIASVVVMPIASEEQVLGVFELLSDKPRAFSERDLSALARLSEMVETAVRHAVAGQGLPVVVEPPVQEVEPQAEVVATKAQQPESIAGETGEINAVPAPAASAAPAQEPPVETAKLVAAPAVPKKPLFWSAAMRPASGQTSQGPEPMPVPPVLRNLRKCQACGFPVSQGRTFCVECEEKQWRGQRLSQPAAAQHKDQSAQPSPTPDATTLVEGERAAPPESSPAHISSAAKTTETPTVEQTIAPPTSRASSYTVPADVPAVDSPTSFLSTALQSESWFAANKYVLGALLAVAIVIAAIALLR
jgi:uncharacterized Zn finger protein (UPF0148 family)